MKKVNELMNKLYVVLYFDSVEIVDVVLLSPFPKAIMILSIKHLYNNPSSVINKCLIYFMEKNTFTITILWSRRIFYRI